MRIARALRDELVAHARDDAPNECCGMIAARDGRFSAHFRARNEFESPLRFQIDSRDQIRITNEIEARGEEIGGDLPLAPEQRGLSVADRRQPGALVARSRSG